MKAGTDGPFPSHSHRAGSLPDASGWSREERAGAGAGAEALQRAANESSCCLSRCVHLGFATWAPRETTEPEPRHRAGQHPICGIKGRTVEGSEFDREASSSCGNRGCAAEGGRGGKETVEGTLKCSP